MLYDMDKREHRNKIMHSCYWSNWQFNDCIVCYCCQYKNLVNFHGTEFEQKCFPCFLGYKVAFNILRTFLLIVFRFLIIMNQITVCTIKLVSLICMVSWFVLSVIETHELCKLPFYLICISCDKRNHVYTKKCIPQ